MIKTYAIAAAVLALVGACPPALGSKPEFKPPQCADSIIDNTTGAAAVRQVYDAFALAMTEQLVRQSPDKNLVLSPVSIHLAMTMALAGAQGKTASGLIRSLSMPKTVLKSLDKSWYALQAPVLARLTCPAAYQTHTLRVVNTMFAQAGKVFEKNFLRRLDQAFGAAPKTVDYAKNPEKARVAINDWVAKQTEEKIRDLLAKGVVDTATRLTLVNALYLKAAWEQPFEVEMTRSGQFHLSATQQIKVPMMQRDGGSRDYAYAKLPNAEAVRLDLAEGRITMTIIIPSVVDGLLATEKALTASDLLKLDAGMERRKVNLTMPKFRSSGSFRLGSMFKRLGGGAAFSAKNANFKGIDGGKDLLFVSEVAHKTFVDIHELGLEAAAATATSMKAGSAPPPPQEPINVVVDRPFLFVIRASPDAVPLIWGRIVDPRASGG